LNNFYTVKFETRVKKKLNWQIIKFNYLIKSNGTIKKKLYSTDHGKIYYRLIHLNQRKKYIIKYKILNIDWLSLQYSIIG
jgi:hypothetical protein